MTTGRRIHIWCPGVDEEQGGIEKYSAFLVRAVRQWAGHDFVSVFAKNDEGPVLRELTSRKIAVRKAGSVPLKLRTPVFSGLLAAHAVLQKPDLIISTHLNFSPLARRLKARFRIPYWISLHGVEAWQLKRADRQRGVTHADWLLPVSRFTRDVVCSELGIERNRFRLLHNAIDPDQFSIGPKPEHLLKRHGIAREQPVILTVGRLDASEAYKGHDRIISILPEILRQVPGALYLVAGDGEDRRRLEDLATAKGIRNSVLFAGRVTRGELADYYRLCDVFAMPSTGEGFGIVFVEALACGKAVLAGNRDGGREALCDGELGVLVNPDDPVQICTAITRILKGTFAHPLLNNPAALRQRVIECFSTHRFDSVLAGYLEEFMASGKTE